MYVILDIYTHSVYNIIVRRYSCMRARELEKILRDNGWYPVKQVGSHKQFKHLTLPGKITIPIHTGDLDKRTVDSILRQAGLK